MPSQAIEGVSLLPQVSPGVGAASNAAKEDFADWVKSELEALNGQIRSADLGLRDLAVGETDNLHQVMLAISKAEISMELVVQVRNRLLEGYQEVMRMQI